MQFSHAWLCDFWFCVIAYLAASTTNEASLALQRTHTTTTAKRENRQTQSKRIESFNPFSSPIKTRHYGCDTNSPMGASHLFSQTGCYRICPAALLDSLGSDWFLFTWAQAANSGGRLVQPLLGAAKLLWPDRSFWAHPLTVIGFGHTVMASHAQRL